MLTTVRKTAFVAAMALAAMTAEANEEAEAVIARLHQALVAAAVADPLPDLAERIAALDSVVRGTHDLARMGELAVRRRNWREFSEEQREQFIDVFSRLSVATYADRFATVGPDTFELAGSEPMDDAHVEVKSLVKRPGSDQEDNEDVELNYLMELDGDAWRIINVFADGVSELSLMASEYFQILEASGFEGLVSELESQIENL